MSGLGSFWKNLQGIAARQTGRSRHERQTPGTGHTALHGANTLLSDLHIPSQTIMLPFHSDLLPIRAGGLPEIWSLQGILAVAEKDTALPSLGRKRIRPCPLKKCGPGEKSCLQASTTHFTTDKTTKTTTSGKKKGYIFASVKNLIRLIEDAFIM